MAQSTIRNQLLIQDGTGNKLPIQTGCFVTSAVNIEDQNHLSFTIGIDSATGPAGAGGGGFTGTLLIQGTNELAQSNGYTGTPEAGNQRRPGTNGATGALYWRTIPSGSIAITNATNVLLLDFSAVGCAFIRCAFNYTQTGAFTPLSPIVGSGAMNIYLTAKHSA